MSRLPQGLSRLHPAMLLASGGGIGWVPVASGTWGSLLALPIGWWLHLRIGVHGLIVATAIAFALGTLASSWLLRHGAGDDPGWIVIDEIAAQWLVLAFVPLTWWGYALGFVAFRAADILKPFPVGWCDRRIGGGFGVMFDDIVAALLAGPCVWLACRFLPLQETFDAFG